MDNAEKIATWRKANPNTQVTFDVLCEVLGVDSLVEANLQEANLWCADLREANLAGVASKVLQITGLHPYPATLIPTPTGWHLTIGCWKGTIDDLRTLAAQDDGWPEAKGAEITRRRPLLYAIADMCETHTRNHEGLIERLAAKWGTGRGQE